MSDSCTSLYGGSASLCGDCVHFEGKKHMSTHPDAGGWAAPAGDRESLTDRLKRYILDKRMLSGDPLPSETDLAEILSASRSSVREALRTLAALDIIEIRHGHGTFVGQMSFAGTIESLIFKGLLSSQGDLEVIDDLIDLREAFDIALTDHVMAGLAQTPDPNIEETLADMDLHAAANNPAGVEAAEKRFHEQLLGHAGNKLATQLGTALWQVHTTVANTIRTPSQAELLETAKIHRTMYVMALHSRGRRYQAAILDRYEPLRGQVEKLTGNSEPASGQL